MYVYIYIYIYIYKLTLLKPDNFIIEQHLLDNNAGKQLS